jgi:hypothetical protein
MKKTTNDDSMPEEIDFARGIRGKYASRYREGVSIRETPPMDPIALYETQSRLGHALWQAQALEAAFVAYFSLVQEMAVKEAGARVHELLEHSVPQPPPNDLWQSLLDLGDLSERIYRLVPERNWVVHRCSFELSSVVDSPDRGGDITFRLQGFADEARYLSEHLIRVLELKLSHKGMTPPEIQTRTQQVIQAWAETAA